MLLRNTKLFIGLFIVFAYINIGVFGLISFNRANHEADTPMVNCPYTENGYSICENTLEHVSRWQQFSNVISPSLFIFLILIAVLYFIGKQNALSQKRYFYRWKHSLYNKKLYSYNEEIIKWLSLFENSPSFSYARHS
ncbi:MAG TPA: hypothetical protein VJH06_00430 [Candidatus Paceibacterota bacterium]